MHTLLDTTAGTIGELFIDFFEFVKSAFLQFTLRDAIDILILSVILFLVYRFLRSRKAGALFLGIGIFLVILLLTSLFDLRATSFIFSEIFKIGALAIIIVFQPEIRDVLEKIGSGSIGNLVNFGDHKKKRALYQSVITNICTAVNDLSASKTGALIVISRTTKLDDIIETGITINADVNSFLLRNLFYNKAPLHDGAVIIDEARVVAASCLLPLTRRTDVDSDLGTRHRAAIGMSEASDAVVIIVSEETGTVSVAYDCTLTRNYTAETLRKFLIKKLIGNQEDEKEG